MVNDLSEINDPDRRDILEVGFLEILTDEKKSQEYSQKYLTGSAHVYFNELFIDRFRKLTSEN